MKRQRKLEAVAVKLTNDAISGWELPGVARLLTKPFGASQVLAAAAGAVAARPA